MSQRYCYSILIGIFGFWANGLWAQTNPRQANQWFFGDGYGLIFQNGEAVPQHDNALFTYEASTAMCDKEGNLLFYTNSGGRQDGTANGFIWNRAHEPMEGGSLDGGNLGGGYSAAQGCISFKKPGTNDLYCLFTVDEFETLTVQGNTFPQGKGLSYFEIDMSADGGLGAVTISNEKIMASSFEYLSATLHGNCEDYWVMALSSHYFLEDDFDAADSIYVFKQTASGLEEPLIFPLPEGNAGVGDEYGLIRISPDGQRIICGRYMYAFDKWTGQVSDPYDLYIPFAASELSQWCFSSNGKYLYRFKEEISLMEARLTIFQMDLEAADLVTSSVLLGTTTYEQVAIFGTPQIGPNGKIYLPVQARNSGSPTFLSTIHQPNKKGEKAELIFNDLTITKGSGFSRDSRFLRLGNYTDHLFYFNPTIDVQLGKDTIVDCKDPLLILEGPPGMDCYYWSNGSMEQSLEVRTPGLYWLEVRKDCEMGLDSIWVEVYDEALGALDLGPDQILCEGEELPLSITFPGADYLWSDGSTQPDLLVLQGGTYAVTVSLGNCSITDSIDVRSVPELALDLGRDTSLCLGETVKVPKQVGPFDYFIWRDGSDSLQRTFSQSGYYELTIGNECGALTKGIRLDVEECLIPPCEVYVPNVFSPNQDGINDTFKAFTQCPMSSFRLQIFNRWGSLLFDGTDIDAAWDGRYKGELLSPGVYVWWVEYQGETSEEKKILYGDLTLLR
ncbi:MAG: gliding motility-associated C-terminal domain-containing protein [Bacteroidota bacterium]